jgi:hypothetical protein
MTNKLAVIVLVTSAGLLQSPPARSPYVMEHLGRGVVAVRTSESAVYVGWRLLGTDPGAVAFNVYRTTGVGRPAKLNRAPLAVTTDFIDSTADLTQPNAYRVRPVLRGVEQAASAPFTLPANAVIEPYLTVPLDRPAGGVVEVPPGVAGSNYTYSPNDASVGDLDGDGEYEIVLKWDPSNAKDTASAGLSARVLLDAYKLDGTRLWRIDHGRNIRAGAHYTQFIVYDLNGDGRAELACKTADGTVDGQGRVIGDASKDYRSLTVDHGWPASGERPGRTLRQGACRPGVLHDLRRQDWRRARDDDLCARPRTAGRMGRHRRQRRERPQREPRRPVSGRRRVSRRPSPERRHGARILRTNRAGRVGLEEREADIAVGVRFGQRVNINQCEWGPTPTRSRCGARRLALLARGRGRFRMLMPRRIPARAFTSLSVAVVGRRGCEVSVVELGVRGIGDWYGGSRA